MTTETHGRELAGEEAQFIAWTDFTWTHLTCNGDRDSLRQLALIMARAHHPSLDPAALSDTQRQWLEHYDHQHQAHIRAAYRQLLTEFREWQRSQLAAMRRTEG